MNREPELWPAIGKSSRWVVIISMLCLAILANAQSRLNFSVDLSPASVFGGASSTGTVTLNQSAPSAGITITLSSNNTAATVPPSVTITSGLNSATFTVATSAVTADTEARITASFGTRSSSAGLRIETLEVQSLALSPTSVTGGNSALGLVTLNGEAPTGGASVNLSTNSTSVIIPASVSVAAGETSASFSVSTVSVTNQTQARINASLGKSSQSGSLTIEPAATFSVAMNPASVGGGARSTGTITLSGAAPKGGLAVSLSSSSSMVFVEPNIRIQSGATSGTFGVQTTGVASSTVATITVTIGSEAQSATLTLTPAVLASVVVNPNTVGGGASPWGLVTLNGVAPQGGLVVTLASNQSSVTVPATVTVPDGRNSALFAIKTSTVTSQAVATITASAGSISETASLTVNPLTVSSISVNPSDIVGGKTALGVVQLNGSAGKGGVVVTLSSSDPSTTVPATVTVPAGSNKAKFAVTTTSVVTQTPATLTATLGSVSQTATLTVNAVSVVAVAINPSRIVGGSTSTGIILLDGPAPVGGLVVTLASNSTSATVPATVTVPAGQNAVTFLVQSTAVTAKTKVQIAATAGASSVSADLTLMQKSN